MISFLPKRRFGRLQRVGGMGTEPRRLGGSFHGEDWSLGLCVKAQSHVKKKLCLWQAQVRLAVRDENASPRTEGHMERMVFLPSNLLPFHAFLFQ